MDYEFQSLLGKIIVMDFRKVAQTVLFQSLLGKIIEVDKDQTPAPERFNPS